MGCVIIAFYGAAHGSAGPGRRNRHAARKPQRAAVAECDVQLHRTGCRRVPGHALAVVDAHHLPHVEAGHIAFHVDPPQVRNLRRPLERAVQRIEVNPRGVQCLRAAAPRFRCARSPGRVRAVPMRTGQRCHRQPGNPQTRNGDPAGSMLKTASARKSRKAEVRIRMEQHARRMQRATRLVVRGTVEAGLPGQSRRTFQLRAQVECARHLAKRCPHFILKGARKLGQAVDRAGKFGLRLPRRHAPGIDLHSILLHRQCQAHIQRHGPEGSPMESSRRHGKLSAVPRPRLVIIELRTQIAALRVERRLPLAGHFEAAILQAEAADCQI